ncbi:MAG: periplasmic heavy metal sensor [Chitinivibrionales bacterium]|nr:periplasmic heavy metal sensor [Chitinivibrionales bacterium]
MAMTCENCPIHHRKEYVMKRTALIAVVTALVLSMGASSAFARRGPGGGCRFGGPIDRLANIVPDLTEDQREELEQILEKGRESMRVDRVKMLKLRRELRELIVDGAKESATDAKIDAITAVRASMMKRRVALMNEARGVLTDEQLEVLKDIGMPIMGLGMHGKGGCGGPGGAGCGAAAGTGCGGGMHKGGHGGHGGHGR